MNRKFRKHCCKTSLMKQDFCNSKNLDGTFWLMTLYSLIDGYHCFRGNHRLFRIEVNKARCGSDIRKMVAKGKLRQQDKPWKGHFQENPENSNCNRRLL
jgi:hypothetical protein